MLYKMKGHLSPREGVRAWHSRRDRFVLRNPSMLSSSRHEPKRRGRLSRSLQVETLESRALLATGTFVAPDLTPYIQAAFHGRNTGPATIQRMLTSLETQLQTGPLADLQAGTIDKAMFATNVNNLVVSYQSNVSLQL